MTFVYINISDSSVSTISKTVSAGTRDTGGVEFDYVTLLTSDMSNNISIQLLVLNIIFPGASLDCSLM